MLLGLAFYGYDWNTTSGGTQALGYSQALALAERYAPDANFDPIQQSLTFMYSSGAGEDVVASVPQVRLNHRVTVRTPPTCGLEPPPSPPAPAPRPTPEAGTPQDHEVWIEDSGSVAARLSLADRYGLRGVSAWRLGLEDPGVWPLFDGWRAADTTASGS